MEKHVKLYFEIQFAKHSEGNLSIFSTNIFQEKFKKQVGVQKLQKITLNKTGYNVLVLMVAHFSGKVTQFLKYKVIKC